MITNNQDGFTLVEMVVIIAVFLILTVFGLNLFVYSAEESSRVAVRNELFENAQLALDFLKNEVRCADEYDVMVNANNTLLLLKLKNNNDIKVFRYNATVAPTSNLYKRLDYGGNDWEKYTLQELASYINNIEVTFIKNKYSGENEAILFKITTDNKISQSPQTIVEPVVLQGEVSVKYKMNRNIVTPTIK